VIHENTIKEKSKQLEELNENAPKQAEKEIELSQMNMQQEMELKEVKEHLQRVEREKESLQFIVEYVYRARIEYNSETGIPVTTEVLYSQLNKFEQFEEWEQKLSMTILDAISTTIFRSKDNIKDAAFWLATGCSLLELMQKDKDKFSFSSKVYDEQFLDGNTLYNTNLPPDLSPLLCEGKLQEIVWDTLDFISIAACRKLVRVCLEAFLLKKNLVFSVEKSMAVQSRKAVDPMSDLMNHLDDIMKILNDAKLNPLVVSIIMKRIFNFINVRIFNEIMARRELCNGEIGFNIKLVLSYLNCWAMEKN